MSAAGLYIGTAARPFVNDVSIRQAMLLIVWLASGLMLGLFKDARVTAAYAASGAVWGACVAGFAWSLRREQSRTCTVATT